MNQLSPNMLISTRLTGRAYNDAWAGRAADRLDHPLHKALTAEAGRLQRIRSAIAIPEVCGPAIQPSWARGAFVLVENVELLPVGKDKVEAVHRGYGGRSAIRRADAFDAMEAAARRLGQPCIVTPSQIAMGRRYHDLVELLAAGGYKLSQLQGSGGGGDGTSWIDTRLEISAEVEQLRARIGQRTAIAVRRIRPSKRGGPEARAITDRALVDAVCLQDRPIKAILKDHGWSSFGGNVKALSEALSGALDRMVGQRGQK